MEEVINIEQVEHTVEELEEKSEELKHLLFKDVFKVIDVFERHFHREMIDFEWDIVMESLISYINSLSASNRYINVLVNTLLIGEENLNDIQKITLEETIRYIKPIIRSDILNITIRFPKTTVTNEYGKSVDVLDLFCRIKINKNGTLYDDPLYNRTTYQEVQWASRYIHSHIQELYRNLPNEWKKFCYGSGPLRDIIRRLKSNYDEIDWMQFCIELKRSIEVESLEGIPYKYIEKIKYDTTRRDANGMFHCSDGVKSLNKTLLNILIYILENDMIKFEFRNGRYEIGMSPFEFRYVITKAIHTLWKEDKNYFKHIGKEWKDYKLELLDRYSVDDKGELKIIVGSTILGTDYLEKDGMYMFDFKGNPVHLKIIPDPHKKDESILLVKNGIANRFKFNILYLVNSNYEKNNKKDYPISWKSSIVEPERSDSWI